MELSEHLMALYAAYEKNADATAIRSAVVA